MVRRNLKKMLTVALAAAMVVTAVPMQSAQAAKVTSTIKKAKKTVVVTNQKELEAALKAGTAKKIKIKTDAKVNFNIKKGEYKGLKVVVDAPNAKIKNNAFGLKKIKVDSLAKWTEKAEGNKFVVTAAESKIVVTKNAAVEAVSYKGEGAKAELKVNGSVAQVVLEKALEMVVSGKAESVAIEVAKTAEGATITATVTVKVEAAANVKVELAEGAEGSKVETTDTTVKVEVKNETKEEVTVTTPAGEQKVEAGATGTTEGTTGGNTGSGTTGGSAGGGYTPAPEVTGVAKYITTSTVDGKTTYTLKDNKTFEDFASVKVKVTSPSVKGEEITIVNTEGLKAWKDKANGQMETDPAKTVENWVAVERKDYKYENGTMTITGKAGSAVKDVVVTEGTTVQRTATVEVKYDKDTKAIVATVLKADSPVAANMVITSVKDKVTVTKNGAEYVVTPTTITVNSKNATLEFVNFEEKTN